MKVHVKQTKRKAEICINAFRPNKMNATTLKLVGIMDTNK